MTHSKHPIGKWVRFFGDRFWEGGCACGSGENGYEIFDGNRIYLGISCKVCRREDNYRPEIMDRAYDESDVDEPIEED